MRRGGDHDRQPGAHALQCGGDQLHAPDRAHQRGQLGGDHRDQPAGFGAGQRQAVDARQLQHHRRVQPGGGEQVGHRDRVQRHRHALGEAVLADQFRGHGLARLRDACADLVGEPAGVQAGVDRRQRLALARGDRQQAFAQGGDVGKTRLLAHLLVPAGVDLDHALRGRVRRHREHVFRTHQAGHAQAQVLQQVVQVLAAVAIGLVQRQQQRTLGGGERLQRVEFLAGKVAVADEHHQVADLGHLERQPFARLAVQLVDAGRVDQHQAALLRLVEHCVFGVGGGAVQDAHGERLAAEQGIAQRRLAGGDAAEHGDMQFAALELVQHALDAREVACQFAAHRGRDGRVVQQRTQAVGDPCRAGGVAGRRCGHAVRIRLDPAGPDPVGPDRAGPDQAAQAPPQRVARHRGSVTSAPAAGAR